MAANPGWSGTMLRSLAAWLSRAADDLERPVARVLTLEPAPLPPTVEDRLAEIRTRAHVPYY
jgi:delta 1-pyrroline-5-carboxylate dehydrogenase